MTVFEILDETRYIRLGVVGDINAARRRLEKRGRGLCDEAGHVHTQPAGLSRSYEYIIIAGDHEDLSLQSDGYLDYERWDALPRIERWQCGRYNNKTFVRRLGLYEGKTLIPE